MPGNLSWLAGLGAGLSNLGQNLNTQSLLDKEMQRQKAIDAFNQLIQLPKVGGTILPSNVSPTEATQGALVNDLGNAPGITATAAGMPGFAPAANAVNANPMNPLAFGTPNVVTLTGPDGQPINIKMDPSKTPEALQEQRMYKQQQLMTDRANQVEQQRVQAAQTLEDQRTKAAADAASATRQAAETAATNKQKGDYATLKAEYSNDPLSKMAFDPNTDYTAALANARQMAALRFGQSGISGTFTQQDAQGNPQTVGYTKTGQLVPLGGAKPFGSGGGGGGMGALSPQQIAGMYQQAQEADRVMKAFEAKYSTGQANVGGMSGALGGGVQEPVRGLWSGATSALSNAALGMTNPEYQTYLAAQRRFGNIMANLQSRRYNEVQNQVDTDLSGIKPSDVGPTVNLKQSYRQDLLDNLAKQVGGGGRGNVAPAASGKATISQAQYQAKRAEGYSDAQIRAAYNVGNP